MTSSPAAPVAAERILYEEHPAMFRNRPAAFVLCLLLSLVGVGLILLLVWYVRTRGTTLTVTTEQITLRRGLLSKYTNEVFHPDVRNIVVRQTFFQRLCGTGYVGISTSGQAGVEIEVDGIPDPDRVKTLIEDCRTGQAPAVFSGP
ncbi:MAG: PH domain-containing protein [Planctomycetaceae bacterium]